MNSANPEYREGHLISQVAITRQTKDLGFRESLILNPGEGAIFYRGDKPHFKIPTSISDEEAPTLIQENSINMDAFVLFPSLDRIVAFSIANSRIAVPIRYQPVPVVAIIPTQLSEYYILVATSAQELNHRIQTNETLRGFFGPLIKR